MELLFNYLGELSHPEILSFLLLLLTIGDTFTALMWRNKKRLSIKSKTLWVGFALNASGASVPYLICKIPLFDSNDLFVIALLIAWSVFFGLATGFSFIANYKLASAESYEALMKVVPHVFKAEIANKIGKHVLKQGPSRKEKN